MGKSANTDHQNIESHQIETGRPGASIVEREQDCKMRKTKEAIHIRLQGAAKKGTRGAFLSLIYDSLFPNLQKIGGNSRGSQSRVRCHQ